MKMNKKVLKSIGIGIGAVLFFLIGKWTERRANALPGDIPEKNA